MNSPENQSSHHFSVLVPRTEALHDGRFWRDMKDAYRLHQNLWRLVSDGSPAPRDFLFRRDFREEGPFRDVQPVVYMVSTRVPEDLEDCWEIQTRPYSPQLQRGDQLRFTLRANPTITQSQPNPNPPEPGRKARPLQKRHDVIMNAIHEYKQASTLERMPRRSEIIQDKGLEWLTSKQTQHGFELSGEETRVDAYQQHHLKRKNPTKGKDIIQLSTVDYQGVLTVTEPDRFLALLLHGLGHARAFGCGLMLVRRV